MSGESDVIIARHEQGDRVLSGGTDAGQLAETMERHAPEAAEVSGTGAVPAATEGAPAVPAPDKPTRGQARFSELAKARDAAQARADAAEARAKELEAKIAAPPPAAAREPEPSTPPAPAPAKPAERFSFPAYDDAYIAANPGKSYDDWEIDRLDAYAEWRDQRTNIDDRIAQGIKARDAARE